MKKYLFTIHIYDVTENKLHVYHFKHEISFINVEMSDDGNYVDITVPFFRDKILKKINIKKISNHEISAYLSNTEVIDGI